MNQPNIEKLKPVQEIVDEAREESMNSVYEVDVLTQFKANLAQLEDLQLRLKFVMSEVAGLLKKR